MSFSESLEPIPTTKNPIFHQLINPQTITSIIYGLLSLFILSRLSSSASISQAYVAFIYLAAYFYIFWNSIKTYCNLTKNPSLNLSLAPMIVLVCILTLAFAILLEAITVSGTPGSSIFDLGDWSKKRIAIFVFPSYALLYLIAHLVENHNKRPTETCRKIIRYHVRLFLMLFAASLLVATPIRILAGHNFLFIYGAVLAVISSCFAIFRKVTSNSIQLGHLFLIISLSFGIYMCASLPISTGFSWDDQIHFLHSVENSYITNPAITPSEQYLSEMAVRRAQGEDVLNLESWNNGEPLETSQMFDEMFDSNRQNGNITKLDDELPILSIKSVGYFPSALGIWTGRALHLPLSLIVIMGRFFNLAFYVFAFYNAIKIAPSKKLVFFIIGLLPINLFLACNYSYDPWIIGLTSLGTALLMREMWGDRKCFNFKLIILSMILIALAVLVKAVYSPIFGLYLLMPKHKFSSPSIRRVYYLIVILTGILLSVPMVLPMISAGATGAGGLSDARGGSGVSSSDQIAFILSDPIGYAKILFGFLFSYYFNPIANNCVLHFCYLGNITYTQASDAYSATINALPAIFLIALGLFEGKDLNNRSSNTLTILWTVFTFILSFMLVSTALYISFTPVGLATINGVQGRYLLPWFAPILLFAFNAPGISKSLRARFNGYETSFISISFIILAFMVIRFITFRYI